MAKRRITVEVGETSVAEVIHDIAMKREPARASLQTAVRFLLEELAERHPGNTLEVRVPPFGAVQCVAGPKHTRGTPPNVVECDALTWIGLASGRLSWETAVAEHRVGASGMRASLEGLLPLVTPGH